MSFVGRRDRKDVLAGVILLFVVLFTAILAPSSCAPIYAAAEFGREEMVGRRTFTREQITPVPEPSTYGLTAAGLLLALVVFKRIRAR